MEKVKLFATWSSPIAQRIIWALKLKGIEYEIIYEDLSNKSAELLKYNPIHKKVPVLVHNEIPICESLVILEYIDETWKNTTSFLPQDPFHRATARFWAKLVDEQVLLSFFHCYIKQGKDQEEAKEATLGNLKLLEEQLNEKKFFHGETFGYLDLVLGWLAYYSRPFEVLVGLKLLNEDLFPKLCTWREKFLEITAISESGPDQETLIVKFQEILPNRQI